MSKSRELSRIAGRVRHSHVDCDSADFSGDVTAATFTGDGSNLSNLPAAGLGADSVNALIDLRIDSSDFSTPSDINALIGGAPAYLSTLDAIAQSIGDDSDVIGTVTNALSAKVHMTGTQTIAGEKTFSDIITGSSGVTSTNWDTAYADTNAATNTALANKIVKRTANGAAEFQDVYVDRGDGTGAIYMQNDGTRYIYYSTSYNFNGAPITATTGTSAFGAMTATSLTATGTVSANLLTSSSQSVTGDGSGSVAMTINDGYGNANLTFNHVSGTPDFTGNSMRIECNTDASTGAYMHFEGKSGTTSGSAVTLNNMARMYADTGDFHADGNVIAYSTTISDERLKENVKTVTGALDILDQIRGVTFDRIDTGKKSAGVIAQELETVMPYAIYETPLPLKTGSEEDTYKVVEYDALHAVLIEAVKELRAEVEALKNDRSV